MEVVGYSCKLIDQDKLTQLLRGKVIEKVDIPCGSQVTIHFACGSWVQLDAEDGYQYSGELLIDYQISTKG